MLQGRAYSSQQAGTPALTVYRVRNDPFLFTWMYQSYHEAALANRCIWIELQGSVKLHTKGDLFPSNNVHVRKVHVNWFTFFAFTFFNVLSKACQRHWSQCSMSLWYMTKRNWGKNNKAYWLTHFTTFNLTPSYNPMMVTAVIKVSSLFVWFSLCLSLYPSLHLSLFLFCTMCAELLMRLSTQLMGLSNSFYTALISA